MLPELFPNLWDPEKGEWRQATHKLSFPGKLSVWLKELIGSWFHAPHLERELRAQEMRRAHIRPTMTEGVVKLSKSISLNLEAESGLIKLSIKWWKGEQAAKWANSLVDYLNIIKSNEFLHSADDDLAYLSEELRLTEFAGLKHILYKLMEETMQKKMLAKGSQKFVLRVVDPAIVPTLSYIPNRKIIIVTGATIGVAIGVLAVFLLQGTGAYRRYAKQLRAHQTI